MSQANQVYEVISHWARIPTWHTNHPADEKRFNEAVAMLRDEIGGRDRNRRRTFGLVPAQGRESHAARWQGYQRGGRSVRAEDNDSARRPKLADFSTSGSRVFRIKIVWIQDGS